MSRSDEIMKRFEERRAGHSQVPDSQVEAQLEAVAAAAAGAQPEEIKLPPEIARGFVLFEMTDGSFGAQPLPGKAPMTPEQALVLVESYRREVMLNMATERTIRAIQAKANEARVVGGLLRGAK